MLRVDAVVRVVRPAPALGDAVTAPYVVDLGVDAEVRAARIGPGLVGATAADELGRTWLEQLVARGLADAIREAGVALAAAGGGDGITSAGHVVGGEATVWVVASCVGGDEEPGGEQ